MQEAQALQKDGYSALKKVRSSFFFCIKLLYLLLLSLFNMKPCAGFKVYIAVIYVLTNTLLSEYLHM